MIAIRNCSVAALFALALAQPAIAAGPAKHPTSTPRKTTLFDVKLQCALENGGEKRTTPEGRPAYFMPNTNPVYFNAWVRCVADRRAAAGV